MSHGYFENVRFATIHRLLAALALAGWAGCTGHASELPAVEPPHDSNRVQLTSAQAEAAQLRIEPIHVSAGHASLSASGRVTFDDLRVAHVFSPVSGRVTKILAQPGQKLRKGAPLAVIESPEVGQAFSDLAKAQADVEATERDYQRQKELYEAHATSQKDFEAARGLYEKAQAELTRCKKKTELFGGGGNGVTQELEVRAQIDGEVIVRNINLGTEVVGTYSGGTAVELFTIGNLDSVWVMADLYEMDLGKVKQGAPATATVVAQPGKTFSGQVDWISGAIDPTTRVARARITVDNKEHLLKAEMFATVNIVTDAQRALSLPRSALFRLHDDYVAFVVTKRTADGKLEIMRKNVSVEDSGGDTLTVTRGLADGDSVVVSGGILLLGMTT
jgi:cobalt-zinc-cadmium efflux system membrane fusion protein